MTKTQAIKETSKEFTSLYKFGNQWKYNSWDESMNAWRESGGKDYWNACFDRKVSMIRRARMKMNIVDDHYLEPGDYRGNGWKYWV